MSGAAPRLDALDVLCVGETLWDLETPPGTGFEGAARLALRPGGAAANAALALARGGLAVGLATVVGDDPLGRALAARIAEGGVDTTLVRAAHPRSGARTGLAFVERAGEASRVVGYRSKDEPQPRLPARWEARALLLTGLTPDRGQHALFRRAIARARKIDAVVFLDVNARPRLWRGVDGGAALAAIVGAKVIKASAADLATLGRDAAAVRDALGPEAVLIVTDGAAPIQASGPFGELEIPCRPVTAIRPMGAGDAFSAALVAALARGPLRDAAAWTRALRKAAAIAGRHAAGR